RIGGPPFFAYGLLDRPGSVDRLAGGELADLDEVAGEAFGLLGGPGHLRVVKLRSIRGEVIAEARGDREGDAARGDRVRRGVVCVRQFDSVVRGDDVERALALAVGIDLLVDHERIHDGRRIRDGFDAVPDRL